MWPEHLQPGMSSGMVWRQVRVKILTGKSKLLARTVFDKKVTRQEQKVPKCPSEDWILPGGILMQKYLAKLFQIRFVSDRI